MPGERAQPTRSLGTRIAAAFRLQYNVILLFGAACFSLALASLTPLSVGLLLELVWLTLAATSQVLSRFVADQSLTTEELRSDAALAPELRDRSRRVRDSADALRRAARRAAPSELPRLLERVDALQRGFTRLVELHERLAAAAVSIPSAEIANEITRVSKAALGEKDLATKVGLKQTLALAQLRQRQHERALGALRVSQAQMRTIENTLAHMHGVLTSKSASHDLAGEVQTMGEQLAACAAAEREARAVLADAAPEHAEGARVRPHLR
jgi:hypothetical protein